MRLDDLNNKAVRVDLFTYAKQHGLTFYELNNIIEYGQTFLDNRNKLRCEIRSFYLGERIKKDTEVTIYIIGDEIEKDVSVNRVYFDPNKLAK